MVTIDKTNKPDLFRELYKRANPTPGAKPKIPVLHIVNHNNNDNDDEEREEIVLCESLVITEFIAAAAATASTSDVHNDDDNEVDRSNKNLQLLLPSSPTDCARVRLFTELCCCGSTTTFSFVPFTRVQSAEQVKVEFQNLQKQMIKVNAILASNAAPGAAATCQDKTTRSSSSNSTGDNDGVFFMGRHQFSLAEVHLAPFVQRCCMILFPPYDPLSICQELDLIHLKLWIEAVLQRESVVAIGSYEQMQVSRQKLIKRLARIEASSNSSSSTASVL